jgi:beta-phosphoglucomutase
MITKKLDTYWEVKIIMGKYAVLFDMDGVLVDSEPVINAAAITGLAEYGVISKPEDFHPFVGAGEDRYIGGVAELYGVPYKLEMKTRVYEIYLELVPERIKVFEGVKELLSSLQTAGHKMALASSADRIKIDANLKAADISPDYFAAIISGDDVERKKPAPDIYLQAAERISAVPEHCVVIEDALNGIMAAKGAGMKCIAVASSFSAEQLQAENPYFICRHIGKVFDIVSKL